MAKKVFILLSVLTGFFLLPKSTYACGSRSATVETSSCKDMVCDQENKSCCAEHPGRSTNDDCGGQCNHNACHCPSVCPIAIPYISAIEPFTFGRQKQSFLFHFALSSGFHSIWQPPKIS
jgi:hypothetical protein